ncbi:MAG TPA: ketopantoate reductase family protein [Rectinemataceae bacterium]|nr:ketopantoate reductase family protein [Rectinemataceae bacterium]
MERTGKAGATVPGRIESVLVVGAGAVGSAIASRIHERLPGVASLLADGARVERLQTEGLMVNGRRFDLPLVKAGGPPARGGGFDLVVVAVKNHQLGRAIADMSAQVGPSTLIISLLNGIASEDELAAAFGREKVLYAMILGIDAVREANLTAYSVAGKINFGEAKNVAGEPSLRVSRISSFFDRAGIDYVVPPDMIRTLWYKLMINVGINQASAVLRAPYGAFQRLPEARRVMDSAMLELIAISKAKGSGLSEGDLETWYRTLASLSPVAKTSMLQDIEAGRKTEVEIFAGTVIALGEETAVPTPVNRLLFDLIRALELGYLQA